MFLGHDNLIIGYDAHIDVTQEDPKPPVFRYSRSAAIVPAGTVHPQYINATITAARRRKSHEHGNRRNDVERDVAAARADGNLDQQGDQDGNRCTGPVPTLASCPSGPSIITLALGGKSSPTFARDDPMPAGKIVGDA